VVLSTRRIKRDLGKGNRLRVLVVDDSVVIRRLVKHALEEDPQIEVVGAAANGSIALRMIAANKPDAVTLDIEMPEMNGLETLKEIRKLYPDLVVIMFSTLSQRGAAVTLEALTLGANDYVAKAANAGSLDQSMASLRQELLPKLKQFFRFGAAEPAAPLHAPAAVNARPLTKPRPSKVQYRAVVVGVSTGGPNALAELIPMLPGNFRLPVLVVQHMPPLFTGILAERLQKLTSLRVVEVSDGAVVENGCVYIAPGNFHMRVARRGASEVLTLDQGAPENSCRPAVDVLFRSAADLYGGAVIAVIMTGMGQDGLRGIAQLHSKGAYVIAQDERSSVVWGMPGAVVRAGLADSVLDLNSIVPEVQRRVQ
jgi:two-component system chemotaxis response regulator CheB